jgi:cyclopropane-fatty-acyl-phospholipid synthase
MRGPSTDFISRYVFPGGELPTLAAVVQHVTQAGLEIADFEDLRPHYARTLSLWLSRLEARKHEAIATAGPERYRIWRLFLGGMAFAFDADWLSVGQIVAYRPDGHSAFRPWTREYRYPAARSAALASRLTWREAEECDAAHV